MSNFNKLKNLYEDGYRCIYEDCADDIHKFYLKNFDTESSEVIEVNNESDLNQFKDYVEGLRLY